MVSFIAINQTLGLHENQRKLELTPLLNNHIPILSS